MPGAPVGFNSTIKFQVEEGPPPTPDFLVSLAKKKLRSAADSAEDRVSNFARTSTCNFDVQRGREIVGAVIVERFPSVTELQIFCAGAQVPVPPLVKWKSGQ